MLYTHIHDLRHEGFYLYSFFLDLFSVFIHMICLFPCRSVPWTETKILSEKNQKQLHQKTINMRQ